MDTDAVNSLISTINNIDLKDNSLIENNNISDNFSLTNNDMINEDFIEIEEDLDSSYEDNHIDDPKNNIFEGTTSLFCRLLEDERFIKFIKYKDLIKEFIENSKNNKNVYIHMDLEDDINPIDDLLDKLNDKKNCINSITNKKITYPKD